MRTVSAALRPRSSLARARLPRAWAALASLVWSAWSAWSLAGCASAADASAGGREVFTTGAAPPKEPPAHTVGGFSMQLPPVTLLPGEELTPCFIVPLLLDGPSHFVGGASLQASPGMHHGNITTRPATGEPGEGVRDCSHEEQLLGGEADDVFKGGTVLFGSSTQFEGEEWLSFPEGMAFRIKDGFEIVARMHYLNTTLEPLTITPVYRWYTIDEAAVTREIAPFLWVRTAFEIPAKSEVTAVATCSLPPAMHVVSLLPHMHRLGTGLDAWFEGGPRDGQLFLQSRGYDPENGVIRQYDPAIDLSQGDGIGFSCTWKNTLNKTIFEGLGDNEMCMVFGYAWPPESSFSLKSSAPDACVYIAPPAP